MFTKVTVGMDGVIFDQCFTQSVPCEDIDTHGSQIALRICGFFFEFVDLVAFFCIHDTEAACFIHGNFHNSDRCCCAFFLMETKHFGIVHFVNVVTGQDDYIFRIVVVDEIDVLVDRICCTIEPFTGVAYFYVRRKDCYAAVFLIQVPGNTDTDMLVQTQRLILCQYAYCVNARVDTVTQREVDDTITTTVGYCGFCDFSSQNPQTAALTACQ